MPIGLKKTWLAMTLVLVPALHSQTFTSGSDGSDLALDYSILPPGNYNFAPTLLPNPLAANHGNIYNFTTIKIPAGYTVRLSAQYLNGPIYWLAQGAVDIEGILDLSGAPGYPSTNLVTNRAPSIPGAGGFAGGVGGNGGPGSSYPVTAGQGPAGGQVTTCLGQIGGSGGGFSGNPFLIPLIGGSGGSGTNLVNAFGSGGGAGGGAILIASSLSVTINGTVTAVGGEGGTNGEFGASGGAGAGGAVRLMALTISGTGSISVNQGVGGACSPAASGIARLEAYNQQFAGQISGTQAAGTPYKTFVPTASTSPLLTVVSVAGVNVTAMPLGNFTVPDVTFKATGAVPIVINGMNIPANTQVNLDIFSENGPDLPGQGTLTTTSGSATSTTITVNVPPGFSRGYISATWTPTSSQGQKGKKP